MPPGHGRPIRTPICPRRDDAQTRCSVGRRRARVRLAATTAFALTSNTVKYQAKLKVKGKPKQGQARAGSRYEGILDVGTTDGKQPNMAPTTTIYFAKADRSATRSTSRRATRRRSTGRPSVPAKLQEGGDRARARRPRIPGQPGRAAVPAIKENLKVDRVQRAEGQADPARRSTGRRRQVITEPRDRRHDRQGQGRQVRLHA